MAHQAHLVSLLTEGVFERFPNFKVVLVEGGVAWLPGLMWRLDQEWKALRSEVPWVRKLPSEYLRDHVRISSQPLERPANDKHLLSMLEMMDAEHLLMFASDYPHWDWDEPSTFLTEIDPTLRHKIMYETAYDLYRARLA